MVGLGPASQLSPVVRTYPSEAARNIIPTSTDENTLLIKWEGPASKANGLEFRGYDVEHAEVKWTGRCNKINLFSFSLDPLTAVSTSILTRDITEIVQVMTKIHQRTQLTLRTWRTTT